MRWRVVLAFGAVALALSMLASAIAPLSGSMDAFAGDLANGTFRPFGDLGGARGVAPDYSSNLGGFTGSSKGNYLPGQTDPPVNWPLDRDGRAGDVTIDSVFDPDLGAMKRLKAYDRVAADGITLQAGDPQLRPVDRDLTLRYDRVVVGSFAVQFHDNAPVAIFSPHPKAILESFTVDPLPPGGVQFYKDGADTFYANAHVDRIATLNVTFRVSSDYYLFAPPQNARTSDYRYSSTTLPRPSVPADLAQDAKLVLARAGVHDATNVGDVLDALSNYFRSFTEGPIPDADEVPDLYLALALGEHGCCRHRAFAFMITAQSVGIPTRVVVNEAHAFVEVATPDGHWHQINLGGCGTYTLNNPHKYPPLFAQATDPRGEANPDEGKPVPTLATTTDITTAPPRIVKGESYVVNGTVRTTDGRGVPNARVDVYLNATKTSIGKLTGAGTSGPDGRFSVLARVPADAPAQSYQLVARGTDGHASPNVRYSESWSDPPVEVFTPTRFVFPATLAAAASFPANVTGRLVDADGAGVPSAVVQWTADGAPQAELRTDGVGRFVGHATFDTLGPHALRFTFGGDAFHGASAGDATLNVTQGAILLPSETVTLARGATGALGGTLARQGPLEGVPITGALASVTANATTDAKGAFTLDLDLPPTIVPGTYVVTVRAPTLSLTSVTSVRVAARATLALDAPRETQPDRAVTMLATLASDNGTRIAGASVDLLVDGKRPPAQTLVTNATGVARFDLPAGALAPGAHTLAASFAGDRDHVPTQRSLSLSVAAPWYAAIPGWAYALAVLVVLLVVGLLPLAARARSRASALLARVHRPPRRFLALAFVDHPPGVAPVYEAGETARVRIVARDAKGAAVSMRVGITAGTSRLRARTAGEEGALFDVRLPQPGVVVLRAHATGLARLWTPPLERALPVMSYRAAVERGFVALRKRAQLGRAATPGDVLERLRPRVTPAALADLEHAARLFEAADYSERAHVDRAYYHAFARALARATEDATDA